MELFAEISLAAWMSLLALAIVVVISCINEDLNVGFLSVAFAIVVGGIWVGMNGAKVMNTFPLGLFMILVGVTFLFALASTNGTMEKLAAYSLRACGGQTAWLPLIIYLLVTILTTIGPGNIAATALITPIAMAIAARVGLSAFLMTLLVVGASNGAAFSPFAPTGIISNGLIAKMAPQLPSHSGNLVPQSTGLEDRLQLRVLPGHHQYRRLHGHGRLELDAGEALPDHRHR